MSRNDINNVSIKAIQGERVQLIPFLLMLIAYRKPEIQCVVKEYGNAE